MSFILDALRKSETERRKAQVPGIGDTPLVVHEQHVPRWAVGVIAGLIVCLLTLGGFWLRDRGANPDAVGEAASASLRPATPAAGAMPPAAPSTPTSAPSAAAADSMAFSAGSTTPIPLAPGEVRDLSAEARQATPGSNRPRGVTADGIPPGDMAADAAGRAAAAAPTATTPAATTFAVSEIPAAPTLTLAQYRASGSALPELHLELHVYSPAAAERFVFINSSKYVEGQTLAEGPRLSAITQQGAVLIHQGQRLLLPRE